jgi:hypothetical protein
MTEFGDAVGLADLDAEPEEDTIELARLLRSGTGPQ